MGECVKSGSAVNCCEGIAIAESKGQMHLISEADPILTDAKPNIYSCGLGSLPAEFLGGRRLD
ncbi:hypothetical protein NECAME_13652 [Necator americanus]|uniref:Uncharacterized protein n=1 Tax=Necator americanus TaxID=51031 RepID=W2SW14_NECAM|nr:hypothetical protein NECAME_13652 [Necator americanus]ETN73016.1 hypothetical protein NECAME_13652 [Necator americanus]